LPAWTWGEAPSAWDDGRALDALEPTIRRVRIDLDRMIAPNNAELAAKDSHDARQRLETDPLGKSVLDHRPRGLADARSLAEVGLRAHPAVPGRPNLVSKVDEDGFDPRRLVAQGVWHVGDETSSR
jgi:hypothetical protein